jgi:hypothetical protein
MVGLLAALGLQGVWEFGGRCSVFGGRYSALGWFGLPWRLRIGRTNRTEHRTPNTEHRTPQPEHRTPNTDHRTPSTLVLLLGILAVAELWPPHQRIFHLPSVQANRLWINWLTVHTAEDCVIACAPFPAGTSVQAYEDTAVWMYWQTFHQRRMVNGYSGFFSESFLQLKETMAAFPNEPSLQMLAERGVDYCVVREGLRVVGRPRNQRLVHVFSDRRAGIDIYRLDHGDKVDD